MNNVVISPNPRKISERIDHNGNVINPITKEITQPIEQEYVAPVQPVQQPIQQSKAQTTLSIQEQIEEAKKNLAQLEELKKLKIAQMEAELELLKN